MAIAATNDTDVNIAVYDDAERRAMLVNVVDVPPLCNFILPAIVRTGPLAIAISTAGASPALAKRIKRQIAEEYGEPYARLAVLLERGPWLGEGHIADLPGSEGVLRGDRQRRPRSRRAAARRWRAGEGAVRELIALRSPARARVGRVIEPELRRLITPCPLPRRPARMRQPVLRLGSRAPYGEREALSGISLSLAAGQTLVVFGPNGAGKTTLLRVLSTLLRPHSGEVTVLGALPEDAWAVRGRVGLLGHEPLLYRELTARENLRFHARLYDLDFERVEKLLAAVASTVRADEPLKSLSRGMVQRVAVARATLHDPELLLLDEPYSNLDPAAIDLVEPLIGAESGPHGVFSSHDPAGTGPS